jgi:acyl-CoA dehydrogenase
MNPPRPPAHASVLDDLLALARRPLTAGERSELDRFARFTREELEPTAFEIDRGLRPFLAAPEEDPTGPPRVVLAPSHERLLDRLYGGGIVAAAFGEPRDWLRAFALMHEVADVGLLCSVTVTLATLDALDRWGSPELRERFLRPMLRVGGRTQGATWATEEQGGSDLGANRTTARRAGDDLWAITGEKFFCSNVGADAALVTARPEGAVGGVRGLRLFFVPARRAGGGPNWRVRRLKEKLGTVTVPTGEVACETSEGYALGPPEAGAAPILEMLNFSRIANAVGSAAVLQRAAEWAEAYARERTAFGRRLLDHPLLALDVATLRVEADSASLLAFDAADRFARLRRDAPSRPDDAMLLRFTTHAAKLVTAEQAVRGTQLAMETFGGIGYLEERPIAKLVRDALVTPIWEGGANLQALDAREVMVRHHPEREWATAAGRASAHHSSAEVRRFISVRQEALETMGDVLDAKRCLRLWGELRQITQLLARGAQEPTPRNLARAELFARLRSQRLGEPPPRELVAAVLAAPEP